MFKYLKAAVKAWKKAAAFKAELVPAPAELVNEECEPRYPNVRISRQMASANFDPSLPIRSLINSSVIVHTPDNIVLGRVWLSRLNPRARPY